MPSLNYDQFRAEDGSNTKRRIMAVYTGPASYASGGDSFLPADVKLGQIHLLLIEPLSNGSVVIIPRYDYTNNKVKLFDMAGAEIAAATDLSTYSARFEAIGF